MKTDDDEFSIPSLTKSLESNSISSSKRKEKKKISDLTSINVEPEKNLIVSERVVDDFSNSAEKSVRNKALQLYSVERDTPHGAKDMGTHSKQRASLRILVKTSILESSTTMKRRYSYSAVSSSNVSAIVDDSNVANALKILQKERLFVTRLGFPERAVELDLMIEEMRTKAKKKKEEILRATTELRMKQLSQTQSRKQERLTKVFEAEIAELEDKLNKEETKLKSKQDASFLAMLEATSRRALGRTKKCTCDKAYVCKHNKTASYNTRRPVYKVVLYRRNAARLKKAGRIEEGNAWAEKAREIDEEEQEKWRGRVAKSVVESPWGATEASIDQITELHRKEIDVLRKSHDVKREVLAKKQALRQKNFRLALLAEERKVRLQCRKQATRKSNFEIGEDDPTNVFNSEDPDIEEPATTFTSLPDIQSPIAATPQKSSSKKTINNNYNGIVNSPVGPTISNYISEENKRSKKQESTSSSYQTSQPLFDDIDINNITKTTTTLSPSPPSKVPLKSNIRPSPHIHNQNPNHISISDGNAVEKDVIRIGIEQNLKINTNISPDLHSSQLSIDQIDDDNEFDVNSDEAVENVESNKSLIPNDWEYDPLVDDNPTISFSPGSRIDADWSDYDKKLSMRNGLENSYNQHLEQKHVQFSENDTIRTFQIADQISQGIEELELEEDKNIEALIQKNIQSPPKLPPQESHQQSIRSKIHIKE